MKNLALKLLEVQKELGVVVKDQANPFFKSAYAGINSYIDAIKPVLSKHGIVILQALTENSFGKACLSTSLLDSETGESMGWSIPLPELQDPQKMGSAITYYRRYALQSLFVMTAEDDDAEGAIDRTKKAPKKETRSADEITSSSVPF